jgi:hypothetical protein
MPAQTLTMAQTIIAAAASARAAQAIMSTGTDPMVIKEFTFEVNLTADMEIKNETEISLNIWRVSFQDKMTYDYKQHFGVTVRATIVPVYTLNE